MGWKGQLYRRGPGSARRQPGTCNMKGIPVPQIVLPGAQPVDGGKWLEVAIPYDNSALQCTQFQVRDKGKLMIYWRKFREATTMMERGVLSLAGEIKETELVPPGEEVLC